MTSVNQIIVENIVKKSGSSFYWGMKLLPEIKKRAMFSVYAFCRVVDDIADNSGTIKSKKDKLYNWKRKINDLYQKRKINEGILKELKTSIETFNLEKKDFISIIDGMLMDVKKKIQFPSTKELELYCKRVAVAVGYLSIKIFGLNDNKGKQYAYYLGIAFQLTNIVRDFKEDLDVGRCYIPHVKLKKYGIKRSIKNLEKTNKIQEVLQDILRDADKFFKKADKLSINIDKKKIIASELMKQFYKKIHKKMFNKNINIKKKVKLNFFDKTLILINFIIR
ncbi:MAG: squalene synthase HpnD [Rickettsiales bacterium]|nr:squalene synthase HpnD [Rickettsiales bacterium]|tara:strand:- start:216 stop:1052 length:837 start_codon:yes stop_codon:yes gene_type:complete